MTPFFYGSELCFGPPQCIIMSNFLRLDRWGGYSRDYFNSVGHAFIHLFILVTTANFPDVMNPYTECSGWAFIFFATYIVIGLYVPMSNFECELTNRFTNGILLSLQNVL